MIKKTTSKKTSDSSSEKLSTPMKRRSIRFEPDEEDIAWIIDSQSGKIPALIINESLSGGCLLAKCRKKFRTGDPYLFLVGNLSPLPGQIVWVEELEKNILKLGFKYNK